MRSIFSIYSFLNLKFENIEVSGIKLISVPFFSVVTSSLKSSEITPPENSATFTFPSRTDFTMKYSESALTAFVPTPFNPTDFLNALLSYFPPVFILETASTTLPKGIPLPKSRMVAFPSSIFMSIFLPDFIRNSSMELSIISFSKI